jgi:hypothetical protein
VALPSTAQKQGLPGRKFGEDHFTGHLLNAMRCCGPGCLVRGNNHLIKPPLARQGRDYDTSVIVFDAKGSQHWTISFRTSRG